MSVCRGLLSNGPPSIAKLRKPSPAESELERCRLSDGIFPPPPTKQNRAVWQGCRDAQGHGHLRMFLVAIRHPAMQTQERHGAEGNLQKVRMTKHLTAAFRESAQGPACSPAWQAGTQKPKQDQHDGSSQKATTAPACGSGMICPWVLRLLWVMLWCYYVCSDDGRAGWLRR